MEQLEMSSTTSSLNSSQDLSESDLQCSTGQKFHFIPPPEAPVYEPTSEEFQDPLLYISKIRAEAEKSGICKIRPPADWQPPFAVDVDHFKFVPRVQRLNELEATTRIKLNFLDQIAKFWELQGSSLRIPMLERRALDLFSLHRLVQSGGGLEAVTTNRQWSKIAHRMGLPGGKNYGSLLKNHYERILYPFDVFQEGKSVDEVMNDPMRPDSNEEGETDYKPHCIVSRQAIKPGGGTGQRNRRGKRYCGNAKNGLENNNDKNGVKNEDDVATKKELKRLQFLGAGPKITGVPKKEEKTKNKKRKKISLEDDPLAKYICHVCVRGDAEEFMLLCDGCDDSYHTFCLLPPLLEIPKGDWRCPKCVGEEVFKQSEAFGFEQAQREYTLQQFGEMADQFKTDYFSMPVHRVPISVVEKEFWRIVSSIEEDVTVEYGADLHTMDHGSGFPTKQPGMEKRSSDMEKYAESSWNLNNLPVLEGSVLGYINADISGMKVPWMYVGMCFATFCWHNEDHWSYSINYLHWGEPKTWYGVPGSKAEMFENAMRSAAPELFQSQPDLLHQLVTIMNPNSLMEKGVPVYRTDQHAGEFVITFPRAYHAGFNQGYNFAEAVNFAPADWIKMGRECVSHYATLHRYNVFSHDEIVCKMAAQPDDLDLRIAASTYYDMLKMVEIEKKLRKSLLDEGVVKAERDAFELLQDDSRQCDFCKTTCFLSAVSCSCTPNVLVCPKHLDKLCKCPNHENKTMRYRYTLDELPVMIHKLKLKAESFDLWVAKVKDALDERTPVIIELEDLKGLLEEAQEKKFPESDLLQGLQLAITEAEKCASVAQQLDSCRMRTRTRMAQDNRCKLTVEELKQFHEQIQMLACKIKEEAMITSLLEQVKEFQALAADALDKEIVDSKEIEEIIKTGFFLNIELTEIPALKNKLDQMRWLEEVKVVRDDSELLTMDTIKELLDSAESLIPFPSLEQNRFELQNLLLQVEEWESKAKLCQESRSSTDLKEWEDLLEEAEVIEAHLPSKSLIKDNLKKTKDWMARAQQTMEGTNYPYIDVIEELVSKGRQLPVQTKLLPKLEEMLLTANNWLDKSSLVFLKKNSPYTLMEALVPRPDVAMTLSKFKKKTKDPIQPYVISGLKLQGTVDPPAVVAAFKRAESAELEAMLQLREENELKKRINNSEARYCVCRKPFGGNMNECALCKDWYHVTCVPLAKGLVKSKSITSGGELNAPITFMNETKFLCPLCMRSRRPPMETILTLLVALQSLPVRLPEGEALQCLTERAMVWQDKARKVLESPEMRGALVNLTALTMRASEVAARQKSEKVISSELKKAAKKPELQQRVTSISPLSGLLNSLIKDSPPPNDSPKPVPEMTPEHTAFTAEHAYSAVSRVRPKKHLRKSPLVPRKLEEPSLALSQDGLIGLHELMTEGDLMEVSLEETNVIWRLLQATKPQNLRNKLFSEDDDDGEESEVEGMKSLKDRVVSSKRIYEDVNLSSSTESSPSTSGINSKKLKVRTSKDAIKVRKPIDNRPKDVKERKPRARCDSGSSTTTNKKQRRSKKKNQDGDNSSDEDELCAAVICLKPTGSEVDWVQCDGGCDMWFHMFCVGLDKNQISEEEDYVCKQCCNVETFIKEEMDINELQIKQEPLAANDTDESSVGIVDGVL